jgi:membrane associated rhomboid family serine protease
MVFIPLHDGHPLIYIRRPYVAWGLILANLLIFFFLQDGGFEDADQASSVAFGLIPAVFNGAVELPDEFRVFFSACTPLISVGERAVYAMRDCAALELPESATLITYAFLHGDFWHLAGNMLFLWVFADNVEDSLGHWRFLLFYCLCAIGAGYVYVLSDPASESPVIGASGAVAGIVAAYFMLHPFAKIWVLVFGRIPLRLNALWVLGFWILFQFYEIIVSSGEDQVAWWSHIGGLAAGAILVLLFKRRGVKLFTRREPVTVAEIPPAVGAEVDDGGPRR